MAKIEFNITEEMSQYWIDRFRDVAVKKINAVEEREVKKLARAYRKNYEEILKGELLDLYEKYSKDGELSYTEMLKYNRLQEMIEKFKQISIELGTEEEKFLKNRLPKVIGEVSKETGQVINKSFTVIPKATIDRVVNYPWSGKHFSDIIWDNKLKLVNNLKTTLVRGIIQGKSVTDMSREFRAVMEKGEYECRRLIRTETMHMINASQFETYKKLGVEKLEYLMGDVERTCSSCQGHASTRYFDIDKAPMLPIHPNCRCTYAPVIDVEKLTKQGTKEAKEVVQEPVTPKAPPKTYKSVTREDLEKYAIGHDTLNEKDSYTYGRYVRTGNSFEMNRMLYTDKYDKYLETGVVEYGYMQRLIDDIDNFTELVNRYTIPLDLKGVRFVGTDFLESIANQLGVLDKVGEIGYDAEDLDPEIFNKEMAGLTYENKAFTSFSFNAKANVFTSSPIRMNLVVDEGLTGIVTENWGESELVLQRGTKFEIINFEKSKNGKKLIMNVRPIQD